MGSNFEQPKYKPSINLKTEQNPAGGGYSNVFRDNQGKIIEIHNMDYINKIIEDKINKIEEDQWNEMLNEFNEENNGFLSLDEFKEYYKEQLRADYEKSFRDITDDRSSDYSA